MTRSQRQAGKEIGSVIATYPDPMRGLVWRLVAVVRKAMRHVKVRDESDIQPVFEVWLKQIAGMGSEGSSRVGEP